MAAFGRDVQFDLARALLPKVSAYGWQVGVPEFMGERLFDEQGSLFACPFETLANIPSQMSKVQSGEFAISDSRCKLFLCAYLPFSDITAKSFYVFSSHKWCHGVLHIQ